ncbi:MAG: agmatinase [Bacteroidales bacterium]|nr:agmatinase [Bacteroidales bacterium]
MLKKNIETFIACDAEYEDAGIVLFGAPFDSTTSFRPGARFGSRAIRSESYGLETYSPYQDRDLTDCRIFDSGDIELPFGSSEMALDLIAERAATILADGKLPFMTGGEHLVTLGAFREVHKLYPDVHIIHFDAHTDLRDDYLGVRLSHACVIRRCHDLTGDGRIHQFGIRSGDRPEFRWADEGHTDMHKFNFDGLKETVAALGDAPVYFTIDLDVLDPSVFPGTGTPEAGGVGFLELIGALRLVAGSCNVVGCDVNELCPAYDPSGVSTAVACKVVRELLLALQK